MNIILDRSNFNDKFFELDACQKRFVLNYGGAGSGKSVSTAQKILKRVLTEDGHRFLCVRKVNRTIRESVFQLLKDLISKWELWDKFEINKTEMSFTYLENGNQILTAGLDDVEKLKSIHGITGMWIEESTELTEEDLTQLNLRLRGETPNYKQIILTFNPIDETHWLVKRFFSGKVDQDFHIIRTTYKDNRFIDPEYKKELENLFLTDRNLYNIYALGLWGTTPVKNPFLTAYKPDKHESEEAIYNPMQRVLIFLDFNVNPLAVNFAHFWRDGKGYHFHIFTETDLEAGSIPVLADHLLSKQVDMPGYLQSAFFTGDATAQKMDISQRDNSSLWRQLFRELGLNPANRVLLPKVNPPILKSRNDCNLVLTYMEDFKINPKTCPSTVRDCRTVQCDASGGIIKSNRYDITQQADHLDAVRYGVNTFCFKWLETNRPKLHRKQLERV